MCRDTIKRILKHYKSSEFYNLTLKIKTTFGLFFFEIYS